jgi:hypothetical protein
MNGRFSAVHRFQSKKGLEFRAEILDEEAAKPLKNNGELGAVRTHDPRLKRALLYQLSYELVKAAHSKLTQPRSKRSIGLAVGALRDSASIVLSPSSHAGYKTIC